MESIKKFCQRFFIDGLSGMALGLFSTLIIGTIIQQIGTLIGVDTYIGNLIYQLGKVAASLTGAGIACGVAYKLKASALVLLSAATAGMVGAFASKILDGKVLVDGAIVYSGPGEPLGAFLAAFVAIEIAGLVSGKTKLDILVTPLVAISVGSVVGLLIGPPISGFMTWVGSLVNWGTQQQPLLMGIVVSVLMGIALTLPISSAAIGLVLGLSGIAAGAATVGCCANMIGFAIASYKDNKMGGLLAQGLGTSMLQMPNIVRKPIIWLPAIITSAILGPISTVVLSMESNAVGSGMGTSGLVGPIMAFQTMSAGRGVFVTLLEIALMYFLLPGLLSYGISAVMRKCGWIKNGDMKLKM